MNDKKIQDLCKKLETVHKDLAITVWWNWNNNGFTSLKLHYPEYYEVLKCPLNDVPKFLNGNDVVRVIVEWRLKNG